VARSRRRGKRLALHHRGRLYPINPRKAAQPVTESRRFRDPRLSGGGRAGIGLDRARGVSGSSGKVTSPPWRGRTAGTTSPWAPRRDRS